MKSPFTGGNVSLRQENSELVFRKEKFRYTYLYYECEDTKEHFTTTEIDELNLAQVYNQYRIKYGIPFPDEIKQIREMYDLSALKMSEILGFGDNQYRLYESGGMPSEANGKVLNLIKDPAIFETFVRNARLIYFSVKAMSATYILYKVWMFIFSPRVYNFWDSQLRHMRIARIRLWKSRKKRMAEKARKARYRARLDKAEAWIAQAEKDILKVGHEEKTETQPNPLDEYNEVIGKTKIVYLEDPDMARKTPTRSEPMKKEPIEEDEDIDPDDVIDGFSSQKGLTESEKRELMSNDGCVPDPDFSRALTFEELNNVADVLILGTDDRKKIRNAAETLYQLQDTDLFRFFATELSTQSQLEKLLKENMPNGKEAPKQSLEQIRIDWNKYM